MIKAVHLPPPWGYNIHVFDRYNQTSFITSLSVFISGERLRTIGPVVGF